MASWKKKRINIYKFTGQNIKVYINIKILTPDRDITIIDKYKKKLKASIITVK